MLPRIPLVEDPWPFVEAGRKLSELHLGYESVTPYPLDGLDAEPTAATRTTSSGCRRWRSPRSATPRPRSSSPTSRRSIYNSRITLSGIPEAAYRYMLGSRSAIEWIIDRYQVKTDKASGIVNDPNDWSREVGTRATSSTCSPGSSRSASRPCRSSTPSLRSRSARTRALGCSREQLDSKAPKRAWPARGRVRQPEHRIEDADERPLAPLSREPHLDRTQRVDVPAALAA